jgi:hypothetical protein
VRLVKTTGKENVSHKFYCIKIVWKGSKNTKAAKSGNQSQTKKLKLSGDLRTEVTAGRLESRERTSDFRTRLFRTFSTTTKHGLRQKPVEILFVNQLGTIGEFAASKDLEPLTL